MPNDPLILSRDRLIALIETYGAEPFHWPSRERGAARALLEKLRAAGTDPDIEALLAAAAEMDRVLAEDDAPDDFLSPEREAALAASLLAALPAGTGIGREGLRRSLQPRRDGRTGFGIWPGAWTQMWQSLAAALALLALGMAGGWSLAGGLAPESGSDQMAEFFALAEEWDGGGELIGTASRGLATEDET